jgi:lipopolysaccharide/colanic/teichoic acid biosynthesis glycosyltransferase
LLEMWYQENQSFCLDTKLIFFTAWVVIFPDSKLYLKLLKNLPVREF